MALCWLPNFLIDVTFLQVKAARAQHGKKSFGPVIVDQLYGYALSSTVLVPV